MISGAYMKLKITIHGVAYEVDVEVLDPGEGFPAPVSVRTRQRPVTESASLPSTALPPASSGMSPAPAEISRGSIASPIAGTVLEIKCKSGDKVSKGQILLVIEAMKMKTSIAAPASGQIKAIPIAVGDSVKENQILVEFV